MKHTLPTVFRFSFVFKEIDINLKMRSEIEEYLSRYHEEIRKYDSANALYFNEAFSFTKLCAVDHEEPKLQKVFVVVFFGQDWMNFMTDVLQFSEKVFELNLDRIYPCEFVLKDESGEMDDKLDIHNN